MRLLTGLRRLSRALPIDRRLLQSLRRAAGVGFRLSAWLRYGAHRKPVPPRPGPVCVVGFHGSVLGIGEAARACSAALRAAGAEVIDWDISARFGHDVRLGAYASKPPKAASAMIVYLNPRELVQLVGMVGGAPFKGRFCVGAWAWELESIPRNWRAAFRYVDEVWACSGFVAEAVRQLAPAALPVRVFNHPLPAATAEADRPGFNLPGDAAIVLTAFDVRSGFTRKNPIGAVRAYRRASARAGERSLMVCKVAGAEAAPDLFALLKAEIGTAGDVILMDGWLTGGRMASLLASCDIVLSLHRSEGFGLLPAQAMMAGKAVVATGWSGNLDYMRDDDAVLVDYKLIPVHDPQGFYAEGRWADPDLEQAAARLAVLIDDAKARRALGRKAKARVAKALDPVRLGQDARRWLGHHDVGDGT